MNYAFSFGFLFAIIFFLILFIYTKKYGLELFSHFLQFDSPSIGSNKEESIWMNKLMSRLFTHLRNPKVAEHISKNITCIPNTKYFKLISVGSDIEFGSITSNKTTEKLSQPQIFIPIKWNDFSFDLQSEGYPKIEVDFRNFESIMSLVIYDDEIRLSFVKKPKYDFDFSVILWKKYMLTQCPVIGDFIRAIFIYSAQQRYISFKTPFISSESLPSSPSQEDIDTKKCNEQVK